MKHAKKKDSVKIYAMGGVGEIGNNMTVIEVENDIYIIDAGLMHPHEDMLGVDTVIPDVSYLVERSDQIKGIYLTHGHQANIGGLPYLLRKLRVPVYGTRFTLALVWESLRRVGVSFPKDLFRIVNPDKRIKTGHCVIDCFRTYHSVPDSIGYAIQTAQGYIVHTGDYKFDFTPVGGVRTDVSKSPNSEIKAFCACFPTVNVLNCQAKPHPIRSSVIS
ncbi:ribonuclease J2 [Sporolactobacillus inulinus]|uniref:Ribonuclease J2 n=1 Tax=Sporolactobacillus inulinus TaxID=2078 RepID=A0A4Y1Z6G2_9BACL|nr:ribonuclease J2 [Sporolactobacillus inulinus]